MDETIKLKFMRLWDQYFPGTELPLAFFYSDDEASAPAAAAPEGWQCFLGQLGVVRKGEPLRFGVESIGCPGGKRYSGFSQELMPNFDYFLSCGIEGKLEGERYKKSPEIVAELMKNSPRFNAPARYLVFKRWDKLAAGDQPEAVVFFAPPDVLSGLFTLSGFEDATPESVIAPFGAGCSTVILYPYLEGKKERPRSVLGTFDVSARPYVARNALSFAVPFAKFLRMIDNMEESFLITHSWEKVMRRLGQG